MDDEDVAEIFGRTMTDYRQQVLLPRLSPPLAPAVTPELSRELDLMRFRTHRFLLQGPIVPQMVRGPAPPPGTGFRRVQVRAR